MNFKKRVNGSWTDIPHYIHNTSTDTITTPADIYANDTTAIVGLKGNTVQSGAPTPDNPIMPQGTGEKTGNLFDGALLSGFYQNASFDLNTSVITVYKSIKVYLVAGTYTVSFEHNVNIVRQILNRIYSENIGSNIDSYTFTTTTNTYFGISFRLSQSSSTSWDNSNIMLNTGSQPLPYEPYGYKIPILNGSQTTNIYLGEVQTTRKIKKLVLTGEGDGWVKNSTITSGNTFYNTSLFTGYKPSTRGVCTHYKTVTSISATEGVYWGANINIITDFAEGIDTADKWKEYLAAQYAAGTPVCVWYVLATEETAVVNEPIRKIGDYVDTVSGITIPTTAGANAVDVLTTLKPSEVSVNYKGWHPVTNTHVMAGLLADNPLCGIDTYKDELDLATGGCTRRIKKLVLTGEETGWINVGGNAPYRLPINDIVASSSASSIEWCCSHYMAVPNNASWSSYDYCISRSSTTAQSLQFRDVTKANTTAFKQYLAQQYANGTPVTIWCVLATPTTETITVPSGLSGTEEGYLNQSGTPTPTNPIYPTANEVPMWN